MSLSLLVKYDSVTGNIIPEISYLDSFIYALFGFAVTFLGICILIFFVWGCGKLIKQIGISQKNKKLSVQEKIDNIETSTFEDEINENVRVAIIAAIAAYYQEESSSCEFKVRRIKRL